MVLFQVGASRPLFRNLMCPFRLGTLEKNYLELRDATYDMRQWVFVYVEQATNMYNKWTMESNPLLVFRLVAGATGLYILYCIWFLW